MATKAAPQTRIVETVKTSTLKTVEALVAKIERPLGSPINGKAEGDEFNVTLNGNIEIREFNGQKSAYFQTKEGFSVKVNASFNPAVHADGKVMKATCLVADIDGRQIKYCAFVA